MPPGALPRDPNRHRSVCARHRVVNEDDDGLGFYRGLLICIPPMFVLEAFCAWLLLR